jgi:hypothetical protein
MIRLVIQLEQRRYEGLLGGQRLYGLGVHCLRW